MRVGRVKGAIKSRMRENANQLGAGGQLLGEEQTVPPTRAESPMAEARRAIYALVKHSPRMIGAKIIIRGTQALERRGGGTFSRSGRQEKNRFARAHRLTLRSAHAHIHTYTRIVHLRLVFSLVAENWFAFSRAPVPAADGLSVNWAAAERVRPTRAARPGGGSPRAMTSTRPEPTGRRGLVSQ